ncbi:maleylpyruvate isomerase family mycothiol-dependent enzyme [Streptomyces boncukensis]|uniref:Maleylpyruvate isomerase family mycothiol-dependent enzyme n=1 Tax=Streptomyces boncukensis TaxID=2711219 RepID=A0A6G4X124_9ACTN|nr:maleylpyruvate isomerase family mycothiol-dependent enzyme [Streptomyces boncukensis]NGO70557.1 maleylpyruvate isomerase family mycothiol-dependent enzyme [Streptomyces boncukensis]
METAEFIETVRREGEALLRAAQRAGWDAPVPTCPDWHVRDLVIHTGQVHRWATGYLTQRLSERVPLGTDAPENDGLATWFRTGHGKLVDALRAAPHDLECWTFLPGSPAPRAFWSRRQAHETTVHRMDAEAALGTAGTTPSAEFARDGVDELLVGFHGRRRSRLRSEKPRTLLVEATGEGLAADGSAERPRAWLLRLSADPAQAERLPHAGGATADCTLRGPATALYTALWNRGPYEPLEVTGDAALLDLWHRTGKV